MLIALRPLMVASMSYIDNADIDISRHCLLSTKHIRCYSKQMKQLKNVYNLQNQD